MKLKTALNEENLKIKQYLKTVESKLENPTTKLPSSTKLKITILP